MDREEARRRAEIMMAFANGCDVQFYNGVTKQWEDIRPECVLFESTTEYRVKPGLKYRPFKSQEECWNEMLKHQPFGWVKSKKSGSDFSIGSVLWNNEFDDVFVTFAYDGMLGRSSKSMFEDFTFADGETFGIKEE